MYRKRKQKSIIIICLLMLLTLMSIGYAAFQTKVKVKGTTRITSLWDVRITNVTAGTATGGAENKITPTWDGLTANMEANLYAPGDAMEYDVTITNNGTIDAVLSDVIGTPSNNDAVIITFSGYAKGEKLYKSGQQGNTKTIHVKIEYNPAYTGGETSGQASVEFTYTQGEGGEVQPTGDQYLLTYDYSENGGTSATTHNEYVNSGSTVTISGTASKMGWTFVGWNTNKDATTGLTTVVMDSNKTLYAIYRKEAITLTASFNANGATLSSADNKTCTLAAVYNKATQATSCTVDAPTITAPANTPTIIGFSAAAGTHSNNTAYDTSTGKLTLTSNSNNQTWYAQTTKAKVTLTAKWNANGNTLSSTSNKTCDLAATFNGAAQATSCEVTAPTITAPANTPTIIGFSVAAGTHSNNAAYNAETEKLTLTSSLDNKTWYAQTKKAEVDRTITFYKNNNTSFTYNGTTYTDASKTFTVCTLAEAFNGEAQATSCTVSSITMPTIQAPEATPTVIGWSAGASTRTATYTSGQVVTDSSLEMDSNKSYYAQTTKAKVTLTASFNANGAALSSTADKTCDLAAVYNGVAQATSCTVDAPTITRSGYDIIGFNTNASATTNNTAYDSSTAKITLTSSLDNNTWYAITSKTVALTFEIGSNTAAIGTTSGTCTIRNSATACNVEAPSITPNSGSLIVGWSTTNGATTGIFPGQNITVSANETYYGNSANGTPTFTEDVEGNVVITYPLGCSSPYSCSYNIGSGTPVPVTTDTITVLVGEDAVVTATATDGSNDAVSTYTVVRSNLYVKTDGSDVTGTGYGTIAEPYATITKAYNSATNTRQATIYVMDDITHPDSTDMSSNKNIVITSCTRESSTSCPYSVTNSVIRSSSLTNPMIEAETGALTFSNITIDGDEVEAQSPMIISTSSDSAQINLNSGSTIKNAKNVAEESENSGGAIKATGNAAVTISGGIVENNEAVWGGGLYIRNNSSLTMTSGQIRNNTGSYGVGINSNTPLNISGGSITGNSGINGAGIVSSGTLTLSGGTISDNTATGRGGGIWASGTLNMSGGSVIRNTAANGGGISGESSSTISITSGTIGGSAANKNTASSAGGGIYYSGSLSISGTTSTTKITYNEASAGGAISNNTSSSASTSTLTIAGGTISYNKALTASGGGIYVYGDVQMNGGTISYNEANTYGGGIIVKTSATMTAGTISNNKTLTNDGGGIRTDGSLTISGGTISANQAKDSGGGISSSAAQTVNISGGSIIKNTTVDGHGAGINMDTGTTASNLTISGGTIGGSTANKNTAGSSGGGAWIGGNATISGGTISYNNAPNGGGIVATGTSSQNSTLTINNSNAKIQNNTATNSGGGIYVTANGKLTFSNGTISNNSATAYSGGGIYSLGTTTVSGGTITANQAGGQHGGGIASSTDSVLNITGGTISSNTAEGCGGGIICYSATCTINGSGVKIQNNTASDHGGGINVSGTDSILYLKSGTISGNTATTHGGGISGSASLTITGGSIIKNTSGTYGGGIGFSGTIKMSNGTIGGSSANKNTSGTYGGGIASSGATTISQPSGSTTTISYNTAGSYGGGIVTNAATLTLSGGTISNNKATTSGGGILIGNNSASLLKISGGTVSNNSGTSGGGIYCDDSGKINMTGGTVQANHATTSYGGGILSDGTLTMSAGTVKQNHSDKGFGGGIAITSTGSFTMSGTARVEQNYAQAGSENQYGGGVSCYGTCNLNAGTIISNQANSGGGLIVGSTGNGTINGVSIESNTANSQAGGVFVSTGGVLTFKSGTIKSNTCTSSYYGGGLKCNGTCTMSGGSVTGNSIPNGQGGGIHIGEAGNFTLTGGSITNNSAANRGGIYKTAKGTYNVSGSPSCSGNGQSDLTTSCRLT